MSENTMNENSTASKKRLVCIICSIVLMVAGVVTFGTGIILRMEVGKYKYISAKEKNAYITNYDTKTTPPSVYVAFDYDADRYIIGLLPNKDLTDSMKEGDWMSIWYEDESPRHLTTRNPYARTNAISGIGIGVFLAGIVLLLTGIFTTSDKNKNKKDEKEKIE